MKRTQASKALTDWRVQTGRQVITQKESERVKGTHQLESADRWMDKSRQGRNLSKQGTHLLGSTDRQTS